MQERFASGLAHHLNSCKTSGHYPSSAATADGMLAELGTGGSAGRGGRPADESLLDVRSLYPAGFWKLKSSQISSVAAN